MTPEQDKKTFLQTLFNKTVKKRWDKFKERPFKNGIAEPLHTTFSLYAWPFWNWNRAIKGGVFFAVLYPATSAVLFPTGEDFLAEHDIDPSVAQTLSDVTVRVKQKDKSLDRLHNLFSFPSIAGISYSWLENNTPPAASATPLWKKMFGTLGTCPVMLPSEKTTAKDYEEFLSDIPSLMLSRAGVSAKAWYWYVVFHEFGHCHTENTGEINTREADADWRSIILVEKMFDEPRIYKAVLYSRSDNLSSSHDTSLYLDAMRNGRKPPDENAINAARDEIIYRVKQHYGLAEGDDLPEFGNLTAAIRHLSETDVLTPNAQRRAELYLEAVAFYAPNFKVAPSGQIFAKMPGVG